MSIGRISAAISWKGNRTMISPQIPLWADCGIGQCHSGLAFTETDMGIYVGVRFGWTSPSLGYSSMIVDCKWAGGQQPFWCGVLNTHYCILFAQELAVPVLRALGNIRVGVFWNIDLLDFQWSFHKGKEHEHCPFNKIKSSRLIHVSTNKKWIYRFATCMCKTVNN